MEAIKLAYGGEKTNQLVNDQEITALAIQTNLEKTYGEGKVIVTGDATNGYTVKINNDSDRTYKISLNGIVTKIDVATDEKN